MRLPCTSASCFKHSPSSTWFQSLRSKALFLKSHWFTGAGRLAESPANGMTRGMPLANFWEMPHARPLPVPVLCVVSMLTFVGCQSADPSCRGQPYWENSGMESKPEPPTPATDCSSSGEMKDQCACGDLVCAAGQTCLKVVQPPPSAVGGGGYYFNGCFEVCEQDADCGSGRVCAGTIYGVRTCVPWVCRSSAECTADPCGICLPGRFHRHISGWMQNEVANLCIYEGVCGPDSCASCTPHGDDRHRCD